MSKQQNVGGVQSWSVGEIYPYHIVVVENGRQGEIYAQGPAGKLPSHKFYDKGIFVPVLKKFCGGDFKEAHAKAEADARRQLCLDRQSSDLRTAV